MTHKTKEQPLCRACGEPIAKKTTSYYLRVSDGHDRPAPMGDDYWHDLYLPKDQIPTSKTECQKLVNEAVVSVSYNVSAVSAGKERRIWRFTTWDGESYRDAFFCNDRCAVRLAYAAARGGQGLQGFHRALQKKAGRVEAESEPEKT